MTPQRVFITGGANGIGLAIAQAFVAQGARVHVADISRDAVDQVAGENLSGSVGDMSSEGDVKRVFDEVRRELGGLDVLVNNVGISGPTVPAEGVELDDWRSVLDVNLTGTFMVTQRAIPLLKDSDAGTIIVMSSLAGRFGYPNRIAYSTTKWGLVGMMKTLAIELGPLGITANTIHPGAVSGPRMERVLAGRAEVSGRTVEEERARALQNFSIPKFIDPADVAALAVFLAGPHARTISGQLFPIDADAQSSQ